MSACRSCGAEIDWVVIEPSAAGMPIDPAPMDYALAGLVAVNPATGRGRVLKADDVARAERWREHGVTFHRSHFATCPTPERHRGIHPMQEALSL